MPFKVFKAACNECLFGANKIVDDERRDEILQECAETDAFFVCHKSTIAGADNPEADDICCRGFYNRNPYATNLMRIADRLGQVRFVELPKESEENDGSEIDSGGN